MRSKRDRLGRGKARIIVLAGAIIATLATPIALAAGELGPLRGGARNPSSNQSQSYTRETEIIANNPTYGTRQSNKSGSGGGAIYGCRSGAGGTPKANRPCIRANNLSTGLAFEFQSLHGDTAGTIAVGNGGDTTRPFTTNATGVATGLNADRVDGRSATDFASAGDLLFAVVSAAGSVTAGRGSPSATYAPATNTFTVTFDRDVSACSYTATESGASATSGHSFAVAPVSGNTKEITVNESGGAAYPFHLQVIC